MKALSIIFILCISFFVIAAIVAPSPGPANEYGQPYVKTVDGHEYVINPNGGIIHKVNCRYCTK
jgi:hypothetical protein